MHRRAFLGSALALAHGVPLVAALRAERWQGAADALAQAVADGGVQAAVLHVLHRGEPFTRHFGRAPSADAMFLLGSISKPINVAALMTLLEREKLGLDDRARKFLPAFTGEGRDAVTIRHLLTHVSGLPDQLANNNELRRRHAPLSAFVEHAQRALLSFAPGEAYQYSSMGILLAARIAEIVAGIDIAALVERSVFQPLGMKHSAQGVGRFQLDDLVACQAEGAAPEAGQGDPQARQWDWNSPYWRRLGAPWGGTHASAPDVARFLDEFLSARGAALRPDTARRMIENHNRPGLPPRGLGFNVGPGAGSAGCSERTFGHTGSTGTLCWADPAKQTICVVLTSLPGRAATPHPRTLAGDRVAQAFD